MSQYHKKDFKHRHAKLIKGATKLVLNLAILAGFGALIWYGYLLFTHKVAPLIGSIVFIVGIAVWIIVIRILRRRYKWTKPSFKLTTFSVIAILLIFTFAGVQPLATYKDNFIESYKTAQAERAAERERAEAEQAAAEEAEKAKEALEEGERGKVESTALELAEIEREAFRLINAERDYTGVPPTKWDDKLYELSKAHTQAMADRGELFHTPVGASYGENAWGGTGYSQYSSSELAGVIVDSWMSSPLHRAWLLHKPLRTSVVSIVITPNGQYASWTFWMGEAGEGPELVKRAVRLWEAETGGSVPWLDWLDSKGYPYNTEWLYEE